MAHRELIVTFRLSSCFTAGVVAQRWKTRDRCVIGTLPKLVRSLYRLITLDGSPHPVLDAPYESMDAAEAAAQSWCSGQGRDLSIQQRGIGLEVQTSCGAWRTIRYPQACLRDGGEPSSVL